MNEETKVWVEWALEDLDTAISNLKINKLRAACFFAQQAAEKLLKAFLLFNGKEISKTHDLRYLVLQCIKIDKDFERLFEINIDYLTPYATKSRYPVKDYYFSVEEAKEAIEIAEKVKRVCFKEAKGKRL